MTKETWISLLEGSEGLISYPVKSVKPLLLPQVKKQEFGVYIDKLHNLFPYRRTQTLGSLTVCRKIKLWQKGLITIWPKQREISQHAQRPAAEDVTSQCLQFCSATLGMPLRDLKYFYIHLQRVIASSYVCILFQDFSIQGFILPF